MPDIRHLIHITASLKRTFETLTTAAGIRQWWTDNADLDEYPGGKGIFRFHYGQPVETIVRILSLQEPMHVSWIIEASFRPEQNGTTILFDLRPEGKGTTLNFSQTGFALADDTYALMNTGWAYYLVSLKWYLETGKGAPSPDIDFGILIR